MSLREDLEYLDYVQDEAELIADEAEAASGMDRREFVFLSLVSAAASTFGFGSRLATRATGCWINSQAAVSSVT